MKIYSILTVGLVSWTASAFGLGWVIFNPSTFTMALFYMTVATFFTGSAAVIVAAELQVRINRGGIWNQVADDAIAKDR